MKVLYDHQSFSGAKYGGVARYFYDLMQNLKYEQEVDVKLALLFSNNHYLKNGDIKNVIPFRFFLGYAKTNMLFSHINRLNSAFQISRQNFDIFHPTYFKDYFLPFLGKKPFVITHHDVIPEKFSMKYAALDGFDKSQKQKILEKASKIIAVSENTKQDILEIFDIAPDKVEVIYHSTHFSTFVPNPAVKITTPERYLLYVGNRENYKNFDVYVRAIAPILHKQDDLYLLCGGNGKFTAFEENLFAELKISNQILHREVDSDDDLYLLYKNALAFVYPSLYEGFGIPILEAFACNCPVVLSNRSCFPEVGQDAALYFNPNDKEEIAFQVEKIVEDAELRASLIKKGQQRLKDFSPSITASKTLEVYQSVIG
ncbi:D-inositol-3-phosphate glycosyltransferase [Emticicia aquatica]|jgi:glycosyltransferase involved in cell wall biosynthesis|uniref:D-inositol-3-phosphate glycosyltransferase n=1 Tax=Emticicia aquatica TaxID=1681835 RepID=A0ABM9AP79_9BACT|nr:glycosyltransferase family 1 protein [Emticicia aquatica]CAH0995636.1 D-inositol-3-phosphate glycosyltransferase [Emticicia aquatica]